MDKIEITKDEILEKIQQNKDAIEDFTTELENRTNDDDWDYIMNEKKKLYGEIDVLENWLLPRFNKRSVGQKDNKPEATALLPVVSNNEVAVCNCGLKGKMVFNEVTQELYCECGKRIKVTN